MKDAKGLINRGVTPSEEVKAAAPWVEGLERGS